MGCLCNNIKWNGIRWHGSFLSLHFHVCSKQRREREREKERETRVSALWPSFSLTFWRILTKVQELKLFIFSSSTFSPNLRAIRPLLKLSSGKIFSVLGNFWVDDRYEVYVPIPQIWWLDSKKKWLNPKFKNSWVFGLKFGFLPIFCWFWDLLVIVVLSLGLGGSSLEG